MKLHLTVVTPEKEIYSQEVDQVNIPTPDGEIGVLPNHLPLVSIVFPGELTIKHSGKKEVLACGHGLVQITQNQVSIMSDLAIKADEINLKEVEEVKRRAEQALEQKLTDEEYATTLAILEKALAQLRIKRKHHSHLSVIETVS